MDQLLPPGAATTIPTTEWLAIVVRADQGVLATPKPWAEKGTGANLVVGRPLEPRRIPKLLPSTVRRAMPSCNQPESAMPTSPGGGTGHGNAESGATSRPKIRVVPSKSTVTVR